MTTGPFISPTEQIPEVGDVPRHIAIIMDGNGRWARKRHLPRVAGHRRGVESVRNIIRACMALKVEYLTLFAFSSENWRRPAEEVSFLMKLFMRSLRKEVERLHRHDIRFRVIGDLSKFDPELVRLIRQAEDYTAANTKMTLTVAANYGGRWDLLQAFNRLVQDHPAAHSFSEAQVQQALALNFGPDPDLFIRTGGEQRISNFLLWQLAYTELYFTDTLWPDFNQQAFDTALASYRQRERRFGRTSQQLLND